MDSATIADSFRTVIISGVGVELFIIWMVSWNNSFPRLSFPLNWLAGTFQFFFIVNTLLGIALLMLHKLDDGAAFGLGALWLFNLVVGAVLTSIDYRKNPHHYEDIVDGVRSKLHRS